MHEMGIAQQLMDIALGAIPDDVEAPRVECLNLRIGKLAAVVEHSLTFCMEVIAKDTPLEGVILNIEAVPVRIRCDGCGREWETDSPIFQCPDCIESQTRLLTGREIEITSLELADTP